MLSGKRAFHGDSAADTMSAILREEPPDLSRHEPERPARPRADRAPLPREEPGGAVPVGARPRVRPRGAVGPLRRRAARSAAEVAHARPASLAPGRRRPSLAAARGRALRRPPDLERAAPNPPPTFRQLTFRRGPIRSARFAPDGQTVVYSAAWDGLQAGALLGSRWRAPSRSGSASRSGRSLAISRTGEMLVAGPAPHGSRTPSTGTLAQAPLSGGALARVARGRRQRRLVARTERARRRTRAPVAATDSSFPPARSSTRRPARSATRASLRRETPSRSWTTRSSATTAARSRSWTSPARKGRCPRDGKRAGPGLVARRQGDLVHGDPRRQRPLCLRRDARGPRARRARDACRHLLLQDISRDGRVLLIQDNARVGFYAVAVRAKPRSGTSRVSTGRRARACPRTASRSSSRKGGGRRRGLFRLHAQARRLAGRAAGRGNRGGDSRPTGSGS